MRVVAECLQDEMTPERLAAEVRRAARRRAPPARSAAGPRRGPKPAREARAPPSGSRTPASRSSSGRGAVSAHASWSPAISVRRCCGAWRATWRYREVDENGRSRPARRTLEPAVHAVWHAELLAPMLRYAPAGMAAMISLHRDGEIAASIVEALGSRVVRGSSSSGGGEALEGMVELGRDGVPLAITPDGPRGPAGVCKPGVVRLAARSGLPVVPVGARPVGRLATALVGSVHRAATVHDGARRIRTAHRRAAGRGDVGPGGRGFAASRRLWRRCRSVAGSARPGEAA